MDQTYPKELYRNNHYRVVFGPEEDRAFQDQGWKEQKTPGQEYVVYHSGIPENIPGEKRGPGRPKSDPKEE